MDEEIIDWLRRGLEQRGQTQRWLAGQIGIDVTAMNKVLKGKRRLQANELARAERALRTPLPEHIGHFPDLPRDVSERTTVDIPEYNVRASMGDGFIVDSETVKDLWTFSRRYLVDELRLGIRDLVVIELVGDSMAPTLLSGDRALVDMTDKRVGTPGIFALWDGDGTVAKRIERVPNTSPQKIRLISDNSLHGSYEVLAEDTNIIGRVVWFARRM